MKTDRLLARVATAVILFIQTGGKTARDTLFWSTFTAADRPVFVVVAALASIPVVTLVAAASRKGGSARPLSIALAISALLLALETILLALGLNAVVALLLWLHLAAIGPVVLSAWWAAELDPFDPRAARREMTALGTAATIGAAAGSTASAILTLPMLLIVFCAGHAWCAFYRASQPGARTPVEVPDLASGLGTISQTPLLRQLATLVLLSSIVSCLLDQAFQMGAHAELGPDLAAGTVGPLQQLFSAYGLISTLVTLLVQVTLGRLLLSSGGAVPSIAALPLMAGTMSIVVFAVPGAAGRMVGSGLARLVELVSRNALFRPGFELVFGAVASREERAVKTTIDTAVDRTGDMFGGLLVSLFLAFAAADAASWLVALSAILSGAALASAWALKQGHAGELEKTLRSRDAAVDIASHTGTFELDPSLLRTSALPERRPPQPVPTRELQWNRLASLPAPTVRDLLRSEKVPLELVPQVTALLAREDTKNEVIHALRRSLPASAEILVSMLADSRVHPLIRRRIPPVLSASSDPVSLQGMLAGLADPTFEIRERCAQALARLRGHRNELPIDEAVLRRAIQNEMEVERDIWEARNQLEEPEDTDDPHHAVVQKRAHRSLRHVFTLLGLLFPTYPMDLVFRAVAGNDPHQQGTALELLETMLPQSVRPLCALLDLQVSRGPARPAAEVLAELQGNHASMVQRVSR